ncbi:NAD(P)-dependent oxidoreductase [Demequina mangrovi]|uniref:3-hydroxyisobutyrate dehydrogenase n=1 Tax=Demequina mangrovi TaxID=1043493 RepID=A0A1H6Z0Y0_9MICO|nr:NAD(P)-dependent oxidoreductase [Demequina mangrovi]SEJ45664.1 3-hydroxyisobutyrate dehydrogenase [Demequina mangrovi]
MTDNPAAAPRPLVVAVLGTGIMGAAMARNLVRAGHAVRVWNRTHATAAAMLADGATVTTTPAEAVHEADAVLTMLHDGPVVLDVIRQAAPGLRPGTLWLQQSTVGLEAMPELASVADELGLVLVDAPVLGTREPAEAGELTVMAAGPLEVRETAMTVFDSFATRTLWTGDDAADGSAQRLKLVANSWVIAVNNAAGETLSLARGLGLDPRTFLDLVEGGPLDMGYLRAKSALILEDRLEDTSVGAAVAAKDAALISDAARSAGVHVDAFDGARSRLDRVVAAGHGSEDMAAAVRASSLG